MIAVLSTAGLRNWIVANQFVPLATQFGITLYMGNEPTRPLEPAPQSRVMVYERLGLEGDVRTVIEFALQAPGDFARGLGNKALYTVGFFRRSQLDGGDSMETSWLYVWMWVFATTGVFRILWESRSSPIVWLPAAASLSHFAVMVLMLPFGYTDRYILPLYPLLIPYAAFALEPLVRPEALAALRSFLDRLISWARHHPRRWLYLGFSAAILQRFIWSVNGSSRTLLVSGLLLPITALTVARLTRRDIVHRVAGGALFAAALIRVGMAGSLSPEALHDPLFWALIALVAAGVSAVTGRRPIAAATAATVAGVCAMIGILLPFIPDFDSTFPDIGWTVIQSSLAALTHHAGVFGAACLLGLWIQALAVRTTADPGARVLAGARGALLAGLLLYFAGALPNDGGTLYTSIVMLAVLLGLAEAKAR